MFEIKAFRARHWTRGWDPWWDSLVCHTLRLATFLMTVSNEIVSVLLISRWKHRLLAPFPFQILLRLTKRGLSPRRPRSKSWEDELLQPAAAFHRGPSSPRYSDSSIHRCFSRVSACWCLLLLWSGYPPEKYPKDAYPPQGYPLAGYPDTLHRTLRRPPAVNQPAFRHGRMVSSRN